MLGKQEGIHGGWMQGWLGGQWMNGKTPRDFMARTVALFKALIKLF